MYPLAEVHRMMGRPAVAHEIRICEHCRSSYRDPQLQSCPRDGGELTGWEDDALIGQVLDRYQIVEPLGQGGMGSVYLAERLPDELEVAIKIVRPVHIGNPTVHERFLRETKHTSRINSPHVVRIFDSGMSAEGRAYMVMENLVGETLTERLRRPPALRPLEALHIARDVSRALAAAHELGVIHRDLKPDNIFLSKDGMVKVLDFGIAKALTKDADEKVRVAEPSLTEAHRVVGTPVYMSPEVITKEGLSNKSDLYALGVILYELMVGEPPFYEKDAIGTMYRHLHEEPRRLREVDERLDIPGALETLVRDLLEKEPEKRPADTGDVVKRLDALMRIERERLASTRTPVTGDLTAVWSPPDPNEEKHTASSPSESESRSWPMLLVAAVVAVLIGFAATAGVLWYLERDGESVRLPDQ